MGCTSAGSLSLVGTVILLGSSKTLATDVPPDVEVQPSSDSLRVDGGCP